MEDEKNSEAQGWEVDGRRMRRQGRRDPLPECFFENIPPTCPTLPGLPLPGGKELGPATTQWRGDLSVSVVSLAKLGGWELGFSVCHPRGIVTKIISSLTYKSPAIFMLHLFVSISYSGGLQASHPSHLIPFRPVC